jgi:hypothetical protein
MITIMTISVATRSTHISQVNVAAPILSVKSLVITTLAWAHARRYRLILIRPFFSFLTYGRQVQLSDEDEEIMVVISSVWKLRTLILRIQYRDGFSRYD